MTDEAKIMTALSVASRDQLVAVAAAATVLLERDYASFCHECGRRIGLQHARGCSGFEVNDVVRSFDCTNIESLVGRKVVEIRGGAK